jgi:hypothetical protein
MSTRGSPSISEADSYKFRIRMQQFDESHMLLGPSTLLTKGHFLRFFKIYLSASLYNIAQPLAVVSSLENTARSFDESHMPLGRSIFMFIQKQRCHRSET